jgi:hypothetical protein
MLSLGIKGSRPTNPLTDPSWITQGIGGYTHWVRSRAPSDLSSCPIDELRGWPELEQGATFAWGLGDGPSPMLSIDEKLEPSP